MSTCAHCGIVRVHITLFFQCRTDAKKRLKIDDKRVLKAENIIEGKRFCFGFLCLPKNRTNNVSNKIVRSYRVFMYIVKFYFENYVWKNRTKANKL
jgi:hypothetical protein